MGTLRAKPGHQVGLAPAQRGNKPESDRRTATASANKSAGRGVDTMVI